MRRVAAVVGVLLALALPGNAQVPSHVLHREIPGDMGFADIPPEVLARPASTRSLQRVAERTGWRDDQRPDDQILRPLEAWSPTVREMDRETRSPADAQLMYREVFTPSVSPFKRSQAYDAVDNLGRLTVRDPSLRPIAVDAAPEWNAYAPAVRFTGDVFAQLSDRTPTPIPGIAGQQRVVSYRTSPPIPVAFLTDSAGNLFVRATSSITVRLTYVLEAPEQAFVAPSLPDAPVGSPVEGTDAPTPGALVTQAADTVLRRIGVHRGDAYSRALPRMVAYFREFRDGDPTAPATANVYADLALGKVGACRHRAYAFVLSMQALGVPARYAHNEAHAWAEVAVPGVGWTRIDLGGWDIALHSEAGTPRAVFVPGNPDPYPRPPQYTNGYSTLSNPHPGQTPPNAAPAPGTEEVVTDDPTPDLRSPASAPANGAAAAGTADEHGGSEPATASVRSHGAPAVEEREAGRGRVILVLDAVTPDGASGADSGGYVRGSLVRCPGEARDEQGVPVADLPVEIVLNAHGRAPRPLGTTVTGADGSFAPRVLLPFDLPVGEYALGVRTAGDERHAPAATE